MRVYLTSDLPVRFSQIIPHQYDLAYLTSHYEPQEVHPSLQSFPVEIEQVDQKLDRHATDIKKGCERDIMLVDTRLRTIEKKMWTIAGALTIISFVVSPIGQRFVRSLTVPPQSSIILEK